MVSIAAALEGIDPLELLAPGTRVAVAMSGGVDSSVAAARLAARNLDVVGITLAMWSRNRETVRDRGCCSVDSVDDARRVATSLGIRHYSWNLEPEFHDAVISDFEDEYAAGRTPNPCVLCNQRIKFGELLSRARGIGAEYVATGHYARLVRRGDVVELHRHPDAAKDQSYTLHRLDQSRLAAALLPLGALEDKSAVRAEARRLGLATAAKPDSQELCFVDSGMVAELQRRLAGRYSQGEVVDEQGTVLGNHDGLPFYTVGQRSRLNLAPDRSDQAPRYVISLESSTNRVVVGPRTSLLRSQARCTAWIWTGPELPVGAALVVQLRAHGEAHPATVVAVSRDEVTVALSAPGAQLSPGQSLVGYLGTAVVGGGRVIETA